MNNYTKISSYLSLFVTVFLILPNFSQAATSITKDNITWTFANDYPCGAYINGDPWCVGPVTITAISPASTHNLATDRIQNGSMINPGSVINGYDNQFGGSVSIAYTAALNVARPGETDLSVSNPLVISSGNSLVSTKTNDIAHSRPQIVDASVLTIVASAPAVGDFRPPYSGMDKVSHWNSANIRWNLLPKLNKSTITSIPTLASLETSMNKLWLDHGLGTFVGREFHPSNNMPDYGGAMAVLTSKIALSLLLDYNQGEIQNLMYNFLQYGIDLYGITDNYPGDIFLTSSHGGLWAGGGGHGLGRKWPMLFTGLMLNDSNILKYTDGENYPIFQEEQQHFYVSQSDVDTVRYTADGRPREPYIVEMIGLPEWGEQHQLQPNRDGSNWDAAYRTIVSPSICGHVLAALIMGQKTQWNWSSIFEYQDRWNTHRVQDGISLLTYDSQFVRDMWDIYRASYNEDIIPPAAPMGLSVL